MYADGVYVDLYRPDPSVVQSACRVLLAGGVILYPTDTIYGLGCDALDRQAVERLVRIKGRSAAKGMLVLAGSPDWLPRLAREVPREADRLLATFWPGPLTVLLPAAPELPEPLVGAGGKIGVRVPNLPFLQQWLEGVQRPIVSTSANPSGAPYTGDVERLRSLFANRVDLFLESGELPHSEPSTVVDLAERPFRVVREGVGAAAVRAFLEKLV
ncbi:MAG: L-threonylcarbamoyladenylate synthase [Acidobacteriota bacterium]